MQKVLFVLTSHDQLGNTGKKTGFWIEEFASPYYKLTDNNVDVTISSPNGGQPPIDPKSDEPDAQTPATERFKKDIALQQKLSATLKLADVKSADYDAVFYPGGHGPMWDLAEDTDSIQLIEAFYDTEKPIAFVCHAPAALKNVKTPDDEPLVKGKKLTGFTNEEEEAVQLTEVVPFLLEDMLKEKGGLYDKKAAFQPYVIQDGLLITGQNPASSEPAAEKLLAMLENK